MIPELDSLGSLPRAIAAVGLLWAAAYGIGWLAVPAVASKSWQPIHVELLRIAVRDEVREQLRQGAEDFDAEAVTLEQVGSGAFRLNQNKSI